MTERERLIELLKEADKKWFYFEDKAKYLLENGVIVPPVKVGDTVWDNIHDNPELLKGGE